MTVGRAPDAAALVALPLVGAVVGALAGGIGYGVSVVAPALAAVFALGSLVVLTGAIHLDGFLDGCDAFFATVEPERRLEILKDPRHGTYAVVGMFVAGLVWYVALAAIAPARYPVVLAFAGSLARAASVSNAFVYRDARTRATVLGPRAGVVVSLAVTFVALVGTACALWTPLVWVVPAALAMAVALGSAIARRLGGGLVGDAYGFLIVVEEIALTVVIAWAGAHIA